MNQPTETSILVPKNKNIILVFDVETTNLIPRQSSTSLNPIPITEYPYITQLSFILYDINNNKILNSYDSYIKLPKSVVITEEITNLTGITNNICKNQGQSIIDVLITFYEAYKQCNCLIAHNITFDQEMIMIELERNREQIIKRAPECFSLFHSIYERIHNIEKYCTMRNSINICNIKMESKSKTGKTISRKKMPKLIELHYKLFDGEKVEGLHNSFIDTFVCLKCYIKLRYNKDFTIPLQNIL